MKRFVLPSGILLCLLVLSASVLAAATNEPPKAEAKPAAEVAPPDDSKPKLPASRVVFIVNEGSLMPEEVGKLKSRHLSLATLDQSKSDAKLAPPEMTLLRQNINEACILLFSEEHRPDGSTMQFHRYGINIALRPEVARRMDGDSMPREDMKVFVKDFCRLLQLRAMLVKEGLRERERTAWQQEFNNLLSQYFAPPAKAAKE